MTRSAGQPSEETARFHRIVTEGDLDELQTALKNGADVNAPGHVGATALMMALESKDLEKTKLLIQYGADPELTDDFNATALRRAVGADFADGVRLLLSLGVDRGDHPRDPLKTIEYDFTWCDMTMPAEFEEVMSEAEWKESLEETNREIREMGQNPTVEPIIADVESVEVLKLFLEAGDNLNLAPTEVQRALLGLETGGELRVAPNEYRRHKSPCYGARNPERMDFPFWKDMIRTGGNAYSARCKFNDNSPFANPGAVWFDFVRNLFFGTRYTSPFANRGAVWCYDRFGSSLTLLDDGRFVQIGGEHEDYYDPDFFIYNDVVIHDGRGDFQIYGYPRDVFPPTDFHTATLCPDGIYIIGCLGYMDQRQLGFTPVYRLELESWRIETIPTTGQMPGWIQKHRARYDPDRNVIRIAGGTRHVVDEDSTPELKDNAHQFELELTQLTWRRITG